MSPKTIRFASAASAVRSTRIPFASRAVAVRLTRASSATVPNRRRIDRSRSGTSLIIRRFLSGSLRGYTSHCKYYLWLIAYASTVGTQRGTPTQADHSGRATEWARSGRLARTAAGPRHAHAPARDGSRKADRSGPWRLRRARPAGASRWGTAYDRA